MHGVLRIMGCWPDLRAGPVHRAAHERRPRAGPAPSPRPSTCDVHMNCMRVHVHGERGREFFLFILIPPIFYKSKESGRPLEPESSAMTLK